MDVLTGPQASTEQRDELAELAGFLGLTILTASVVWMSVARVVCAPGWQACPAALADVQMAGIYKIPVVDLSADAPLRSVS